MTHDTKSLQEGAKFTAPQTVCLSTTTPLDVCVRLMNLGDQVPWKALAAVCDALEEGRTGKYQANPLTWRGEDWTEHAIHANHHFHGAACAVSAKSSTDHIAHCAARSLMCAEKLIEEKNRTEVTGRG